LEYLQEIPVGFWQVLTDMASYLLFGFFVAGLLSVVVSPRLIERHLGGRGFWPVLKASAFGVPLPLCSCGVIPVSASLRRHGATKGATTAFLISTPQTGVDSIFVTFSLLGGVFAVFRPLVALISGFIGGGLVSATDDEAATAPHAEDCRESCCTDRGRRSWLRRIFSYGFVDLPQDIGKPLLIGLVAAALISALVPPDFFADRLGGLLSGGILAMLIMMLFGIPIYVCATASVPVAAALIAKGVSPGAALVFLMTGPATNAATITTVWKVMGRRTALVYLLTVAATAVASGLLLDALFGRPDIPPPGAGGAWMLPAWAKTASAVVLLGVVVFSLITARRHAKHEAPEGADQASQAPTVVLDIGGMHCRACAESVQRALLETPDVTSAEVDLRAGRAVVAGRADEQALVAAVETLSYSAAVDKSAG